MVEPWTVVGEADALAQAGAATTVFRAEAITYAVGAADLVLVIEPGDRPGGTGVRDFEQVELRPPFPEAVESWFAAAGDAGRRVVGFVRGADGCVALGPLQVGVRRHTRLHATAPSRLVEARLSLRERMPFSLLDQVRPTVGAPVPDLAWLDLVPADPVGATRMFADTWFADVAPGAVEAPPVPVPAALVAFYRTAAGRSAVLGSLNRIHPADRLRPDGETGLVEFGAECHRGFALLLDPAEDDPRVWCQHGPHEDLVAERERLSAFLLQFVLTEQSVAAPFGGFAELDRATAREFVAPLRRVPLRPMRRPSDHTYQYVSADGFLVLAVVDGDDVELNVGTRHRSALRGVREPGFDWRHFTG